MNHKPIISLNTAIQPIAKKVTYNGSEVAYGWGNVDALLKWLNSKNHKAVEKSLGIGGDYTKYPLIWLVEGWNGSETYSKLNYKNVVFHIAVNSNVESLNDNRIPQFNVLYAVANDFISQIIGNRARIPGNVVKWTERANFSVNNESHAIDIWDTLILETELIIDPYCIPQ